jgi:4-amino-4-deoxy-L-arabinose transferase-like glycosyltransferase
MMILKPSLIWSSFLIAALYIGIASIAGAFVPFGFLYARARHFATGNMTLVTHQFYAQMQVRLLLTGAASLSLAGILLLLRKRVYRRIEEAAADLGSLVGSIRSAAINMRTIHLLLLAYFALLAAILRVPLLRQPMRFDEATTFSEFASRPLYFALSVYSVPNNHLLHTFLVHVAYLLFGNHPWALRLPAFLAGLCLVPVSYIAARTLYGDDAAALTAGLVASSSALIEYSTNARGYAIVCLLFMALISVAAYLIRNQNWAAWYLLAILSALGLYTIPIMLYPIGCIVVWLFLSAAIGDAGPQSGRVVRGLFAALVLMSVVTAILYSPALAVSGPKLIFANPYVLGRPLPVFVHDLPRSLVSTWNSWNEGLPLSVSAALVLGFAISCLWNSRCSQHRIPVLLALALWLTPILLIQRVVPFERVWLFALPLYFAISGAGLAFAVGRLPSRFGLRHLMTGLAVVVPLWIGFHVRGSNSIYLRNEGRGMEAVAFVLQSHLVPGDAIVAGSVSEPPLKYYLQKDGSKATYINAPASNHRFIVVNGVVGETLQTVLEAKGLANSFPQPAKFLGRYDSASLYEICIPK